MEVRQNGRAAIPCPDEFVRAYNFILQMRHLAVAREMAIFSPVMSGALRSGLARYAGSIPQ